MHSIERTEQITQIKKWLGTGSLNIFGLPFAGKDTHAQELARHLDATILGGGDILRNSIIPKHVKEVVDAGGLAPTDDYIKIVLPYLSKQPKDKPLMLSSVGRWKGEEDGVMGAAKASNHPIKAVIYLHIDISTALERWEHSQVHATRGTREDDAEHKLETRFAEFNSKTLPVIDHYRELGLLVEIDGTPDIARVSQDIIEVLVEFSKKGPGS
jgi:adenylate kinase